MPNTAFDRLTPGDYTCTGRFGRAHGFQDKVDWSPWQRVEFRVVVLRPVRGRRAHEARAVGILSHDFAEFDTTHDGTDSAPNQLMAEDYIFEVQPDTITRRG